MEHAAIVPDHQIALLPLVPVHELGPGDVIQQGPQQRAALVDRQAFHVGGVRAQEEGAAAVHRIGAHEPMAHRRIHRALLGGEEARPDLVARPREVVHHDRVLRPALQVLRQRGVGGARARELGGAALGRHDAPGEERAERGHRLEGAVAVPEHVRELVDHPPVLDRDDLTRLDVEVRLAREGGARGRVHAAGDLERAEAQAEGDLRLVIERGAAEEEHGVLVEGGADGRPRGVVERAADVGAVDPRGEARAEVGHRDRHVRPPIARRSPSAPCSERYRASR